MTGQWLLLLQFWVVLLSIFLGLSFCVGLFQVERRRALPENVCSDHHKDQPKAKGMSEYTYL